MFDIKGKNLFLTLVIDTARCSVRVGSETGGTASNNENIPKNATKNVICENIYSTSSNLRCSAALEPMLL